MAGNIEEKIVFAVSPDGQGDGVPLIILGVPAGAWAYMKDGKTHQFDLTLIGIPVKLMMYGAENHDEAMKMIEGQLRDRGQSYIDLRRDDFSIKPKAG